MAPPSKTLVAGSAAFLLVAGAVGAQQMRIHRMEQLLSAAPSDPSQSSMLNSLWANHRELSDKFAKLESELRTNSVLGGEPMFERAAIFEAVQNYYFDHRSKRLATRTEFLRPTSSFFLDRFSLPNSLLDAYTERDVYFGTGGDRGDHIPNNESAVFALSFRKPWEEWPPGIHYHEGPGAVSVEVRALGMVKPAPSPTAAECLPGTDAAILTLVPHARQFLYGQVPDADLCAALKPYKTVVDGGYDARLFILQGQTAAGTWLPTILFSYTESGYSQMAIRVSASTGKESYDPTPEEQNAQHKAASLLEQGIMADLAKNVHFSMCEYACAY